MLKRGRLRFDPHVTFDGADLTRLFAHAEVLAPPNWPQSPIVGVTVQATYVEVVDKDLFDPSEGGDE
jgi:hypothetical protein